MSDHPAPRRQVEMLAKISADSWRDLQHHLSHLATEIAMHGKLSASSVSGGYSTGHIIVTSEDGTITHDSWAADLDKYLEGIRQKEAGAS
jgi:hypothetical protein